MRQTQRFMMVLLAWGCQKCSTLCVHKFGNIFFKIYLRVEDISPNVCWLRNYKDLGGHFEISLKKRSEICSLSRRKALIRQKNSYLGQWCQKNVSWIKSSLHYLLRSTPMMGYFSHKEKDVNEGSEAENTLNSLVSRNSPGWISIFYKIQIKNFSWNLLKFCLAISRLLRIRKMWTF